MNGPLGWYGRTSLSRAWRAEWKALRANGWLLGAAYTAGFAALVTVSQWQTYGGELASLQQTAHAFALAQVHWAAAIITLLWLSALYSRRPPASLTPNVQLLLQLPLPRWPVWTAVLARNQWLWLALTGATLALGLWAEALPLFLPLALALLLRPVVAGTAYHARIEGETGAITRLALVAALPLVSLIWPALPVYFPLGLSAYAACRLWQQLCERTTARSLQHARVEHLRRTFQRLQLPLPPLRPDGTHPPRRWRRPFQPRTPTQALLWRSWLYLTQQPQPLLWAVAAGVGLALAFAFSAALTPMQAPAVLLLLAGMLAKGLPLVPDVNATLLPLTSWEQQIMPLLPASACISLAALLGAGIIGVVGIAAPLGLSLVSAAALTLQLALIPYVMLVLRAYLGRGGTPSTRGQADLSAGLVPVSISVLGGAWLAGWGGILLLALAGASFTALALRG